MGVGTAAVAGTVLSILAAATTAINLKVKAVSGQTAALIDAVDSTGGVHYFQATPTGHLIMGGTKPTAAVGAAAATVAIGGTSTDAKGIITITTNATPGAGQILATVTFAYPMTGAVVVIGPSNAAAVSAGVFLSSVTQNGFIINEANAGPSNSAIAISYIALGGQLSPSNSGY